MTVTTESGGRQNAFPTETRPYIDESLYLMRDILRTLRKLMVVGAMIGMIALLGAYVTTGQIIPGIF